MAAGEGIETMLSLAIGAADHADGGRASAAHLAAILFPTRCDALYVIARDDDPAGDGAMATIDERPTAGIEAIVLSPALGDFQRGSAGRHSDALRAAIRADRAAGRRPLHGLARRSGRPDGVAGSSAIARTPAFPPEDRASASRGDRPSNGPAGNGLRPTIFLRRPSGLSIARQNSRPPRPSEALRLRSGASPARPTASSP